MEISIDTSVSKYLTFYHPDGTGRFTDSSIDMSGSQGLNTLHFTIVLVDLQKLP